MVEHDWVENEESKENFTSQAFDFAYFLRARDVFRISLAPNQQVNHIFGQGSLTTKVGLTHNMKNLVWKHNMDIGRVFPQSFDISDSNSEEFKDFREEFKFTFVVSFLNTVLQSKVKFTQQNFEKVTICLAIAERRCYILSGRFLTEMQSNP